MSYRKPEWLDTAIGVAGFCLSVLSTMALLDDQPYYSNEIAVIGALAFGIFIVIISVFFRPKHSFSKIKFSAVNSAAESLLKRSEEIIVLNPSKFNDLAEQLIPMAMEMKVQVSLVSDATLLHSVLKFITKSDEEKFFGATRIAQGTTGEFITCFIHKKRRKISVIFVAKKQGYLFQLTDQSLIELICQILKKEDRNVAGFIGLDDVANPREVISIVRDEQQRYLRNFQSIQKGYISFYGTEVQSVQAGWIESTNFKSLDTLDLTLRPDRLLQRHRYNAANEKFVELGGSIRRVYMVRKADIEESSFQESLIELYKVQCGFGIQVGLAIVDDLPPHYRKDFILYDDSIVLVEDQQASADYTLGRSTANFDAEVIAQHRDDFEAVWAGRVTGVTPQDFAKLILLGSGDQ